MTAAAQAALSGCDHFQRSGSMSTVLAPSPSISAPSCTVACSCMLRCASAASACEACGGHAEDAQVVQARELVLDAAPPDLGRVVKAIDAHLVGLAAGLGDAACPRAGRLRSTGGSAPVKSRSETSGRPGSRQAGAEGQRAVAAAVGLQLVRVEGQRGQPDHHALVGLARMARQRQRVVGVVARGRCRRSTRFALKMVDLRAKLRPSARGELGGLADVAGRRHRQQPFLLGLRDLQRADQPVQVFRAARSCRASPP